MPGSVKSESGSSTTKVVKNKKETPKISVVYSALITLVSVLIVFFVSNPDNQLVQGVNFYIFQLRTKFNADSFVIPQNSNQFANNNIKPENFIELKDSLCPISNVLKPKILNPERTNIILHNEEFLQKSVEKLAGAIKIPTEIGDAWPGVQEDPERWAKFQIFHDYLYDTFPVLYNHLKLDKVNTYGLVFTWEGSDPTKKPIMLTAHQDVVPVPKETWEKWSFEPFSGSYDGKYIYGRGSSDNKDVLIGLMETIELLIEDGFKPERTIVLAFGFDEEGSGFHGSFYIAKFLEERYGKDCMYAIIDEGGKVFKFKDTRFAFAATREKGYFDGIVDLFTPGGHSSMPPDHTSIGIISEFVKSLEDDPYKPILTPENPFLTGLQCFAKYSNSSLIPNSVMDDIILAEFNQLSNFKTRKFISMEKKLKYLAQTSQSVDIINGGEKANALPEYVSVLINHRIAIEQTVQDIVNNINSKLLPLCEKYDLGLIQFGETVIEPTVKGYFNFTHHNTLEVSPLTPAFDDKWDLLSGTIRYLYEDLIYPEFYHNEDDPNTDSKFVVTTPTIMSGNTDTKRYWNLSNYIYRFTPGEMDLSLNNIHSIDEHLEFSSHLQLIQFFYNYILAVDEDNSE
ncbi:peptidase activity, acting on L-amino acid peptides protein [[Candida] boidinii]|nr:peptidase activity, acting on L-amino acid peptides protein [[Candida] boidinii]